jgi:hypothetical protein
MKTELENLEEEVREYKDAGINTRDLEILIEQSKASLHNANESLTTNQISLLVNSLADVRDKITYTRSSLTALRTQRFMFQNSWLISLLVIMSLTTMYLVPQVLIPLSRKEKELSDLKKEEDDLVLSRVETEKQYFMRKINEQTFNQIMIKKQDRILKLRAMIKEREKEKDEIIKLMSPITMFKWFGTGIKNIPKNIKNAPKRLKGKKENNIDKDGKTK